MYSHILWASQAALICTTLCVGTALFAEDGLIALTNSQNPDPPELAEVMRALAPSDSRQDIELVAECLVDQVDPPLVLPIFGKVQIHHCRWKCFVFYTGTPAIPLRSRKRVEVIYIDKDHLCRPAVDSEPSIPE